jgi:hypothetical protein
VKLEPSIASFQLVLVHAVVKSLCVSNKVYPLAPPLPASQNKLRRQLTW